DAGLTLSWVPEACGGSGIDLADGFGVLQAAGRAALSVPLAETMLAGWLLAQAGLKAPTGAMTVAPANPRDSITLNSDGTLTGRAHGVPFASGAQCIAVLAHGSSGASVALVDAAGCHIAPGQNLAGDPSDSVIFERTKPLALAPVPAGFDPTA